MQNFELRHMADTSDQSQWQAKRAAEFVVAVYSQCCEMKALKNIEKNEVVC